MLGDEVPAVVLDGAAGSQFGASVAIGRGEDGAITIVIGAPAAGTVRAVSASGETLWSTSGESGLGTRVGWADGVAWAWTPGVGVEGLNGAVTPPEWSLPSATAVDICPDGDARARTGRGEDAVCGEGIEGRSRCNGMNCTVEMNTGSGWEEVGETSPGSDLAVTSEALCWGDAHLLKEHARGGVQCTNSRLRRGLSGDHLGLSIGGQRAAGVFNRHLTPPRGRIVPLDGGEVWVVDRAAERSRIALDGGEGLVVVGVPGFGAQRAEEGRVYIVEQGN